MSGSFEGLGAYTYSDPTHWSRGVGRLTLSAQGSFSEDVKWKVGGRVDGDLVYATSNFYLPAVKHNQQFTAFWGENYLDVSAGSWDFRVGAQQIIWGEVVGTVLRRCRLGARYARVPVAALRRDSHSAMGGARRILRRRLPSGVHLDSDPDVRSDRQAGRRLLSGAAPVADTRQRGRAIPRSAIVPTATSAIRTTAFAPIRSSRDGIWRRSITGA